MTLGFGQRAQKQGKFNFPDFYFFWRFLGNQELRCFEKKKKSFNKLTRVRMGLSTGGW